MEWNPKERRVLERDDCARGRRRRRSQHVRGRGHWGGKNPFGMPVFVVTHRPEEEPDTGEFSFVGDFEEAIDRARAAAGDKDVSIGGGAT